MNTEGNAFRMRLSLTVDSIGSSSLIRNVFAASGIREMLVSVASESCA